MFIKINIKSSLKKYVEDRIIWDLGLSRRENFPARKSWCEQEFTLQIFIKIIGLNPLAQLVTSANKKLKYRLLAYSKFLDAFHGN